MKVGVVVVTHGQLAAELLNAAEMIVGDLPHFTAVSIGWHDAGGLARQEIGQAIERVGAQGGTPAGPGGGRGMPGAFGGKPADLGVRFLETSKVGVVSRL